MHIKDYINQIYNKLQIIQVFQIYYSLPIINRKMINVLFLNKKRMKMKKLILIMHTNILINQIVAN